MIFRGRRYCIHQEAESWDARVDCAMKSGVGVRMFCCRGFTMFDPCESPTVSNSVCAQCLGISQPALMCSFIGQAWPQWQEDQSGVVVNCIVEKCVSGRLIFFGPFGSGTVPWVFLRALASLDCDTGWYCAYISSSCVWEGAPSSECDRTQSMWCLAVKFWSLEFLWFLICSTSLIYTFHWRLDKLRRIGLDRYGQTKWPGTVRLHVRLVLERSCAAFMDVTCWSLCNAAMICNA